MANEEGEQLVLPLPRGSYEYMSFNLTRDYLGYWRIVALHRHAGETDVCLPPAIYEGLELHEALDVLLSTVTNANGRFKVDATGCHLWR